MKPDRRTRKPRRKIMVARKCYYCEEQKNPWYSDAEVLRRFVTERGKIISRLRSGICAKHQRKLTQSIKQARHLALLPFIVRA